MTLREKQSLFMKLYGQLIAWAYANGYELTAGELKRSDEQAHINALGSQGREKVAQAITPISSELALALRNNGNNNGIVGSLHELGLAADINLFKDGMYLTTSDHHKPLGEHWKSLHPLCSWGGDFKDKKGNSKPDGNHYSIEHGGIK